MNVIETTDLGRRYGKSWALHDCTLAIPEGRLAALVGPNGAGKSTLMNMAVGLALPSAGTISVLGGMSSTSPAVLHDIAFMAQGAPVYKNLYVADMLRLTKNLNWRFDHAQAKARLGDLGIPLNKKAGKLSGGQQAQVAVTLALARRLRLLVLDEPLAALDPLARQDFMTTVMTAMADDGLSVLLSSHALADLERVADFAVVLGGGELQIAGDTDELLAEHRLLTGPAAEADRLASQLSPVQVKQAAAQAHLLVRTDGPASEQPVPPGWEAHPVSLEELVLAYLRPTHSGNSSGPGTGPRPALTEATR
jgi:ABC-2 type transport system ATP-binding protein